MRTYTSSYKLLLSEAGLDPEVRRASYIAKSAPSTHEIGWLGHKKFRGSKDKVQIKFDPNDPQIKDKYIYHTHPYEDAPTPLHAMPSEQDLIEATNVIRQGMKGIVIFSGQYYTVVVPTDKVKEKLFANSYNKALQRGDIEDAIKEIERLGFDIETGEV